MFWDRVAGVYDLFANHINRRANEALCAAVAEEIRPEDEVLECACGTGLLSGVIAERCRSLVATDLSERMLQVARRKLGSRPNLTFRQGDILHIDFPDESFDAVVAANVIHLLKEPERALAELERTGLVYTQRTAGRFVTEDAAVIDSAKQELAHQQIGAFLHRMERMGYDREQTAQLVRSWKEEA